jgi:hypothetical protein
VATQSQSALPLVRIADIERVRVLVYLGQGEALLVHEGDSATVWTDAEPERKTLAKVARFSKELEPRTRTMLTEIELDNREARLYPGAFVRVSLTLADRPSILVPAGSSLGVMSSMRQRSARAATFKIALWNWSSASVGRCRATECELGKPSSSAQKRMTSMRGAKGCIDGALHMSCGVRGLTAGDVERDLYAARVPTARRLDAKMISSVAEVVATTGQRQTIQA